MSHCMYRSHFACPSTCRSGCGEWRPGPGKGAAGWALFLAFGQLLQALSPLQWFPLLPFASPPAPAFPSMLLPSSVFHVRPRTCLPHPFLWSSHLATSDAISHQPSHPFFFWLRDPAHSSSVPQRRELDPQILYPESPAGRCSGTPGPVAVGLLQVRSLTDEAARG